MALLVVVKRRWFWQQEDFYSEGEIGVDISSGGVLTVSKGAMIRTYNPRHWKIVTSNQVPSRARN